MAQKNFKVGEAIEVVYQALNAKTAATVHMEVYDASHVLVEGGPTVLTELGSSGRYYGTFIPDAAGEWTAEIQEDTGDGKVVKKFSVGTHHLQDVGARVDTIDDKTDTLSTNLGITEGKVDTANTKVDDLDADVVTLDSKVVTLDGKVVDLDGDLSTLDGKVVTIDTKVDSLDADVSTMDGKIDGLQSPPMVG